MCCVVLTGLMSIVLLAAWCVEFLYCVFDVWCYHRVEMSLAGLGRDRMGLEVRADHGSYVVLR